MGRRSSLPLFSDGDIEIDEEENADSEVMLRSLVPANLLIDGVSGRRYHFPNAGAEVKVNAEDAEVFLAMRKARACCGGAVEQRYFELA